MSANLMLREIGIALFLAAVGIGAGDGFIDAIVDGGYRWIGYGVTITVLPLIIVALVARLWLKMNYYTLMGLIAGSTTDPPALAYANATAGNDMPAVGYSTVYPVVMFLRVLTAQIFILFALEAGWFVKNVTNCYPSRMSLKSSLGREMKRRSESDGR